MSYLTSFRTFFGDGEREFCLTPELIPELERLTGKGIGGLLRRLVDREFFHGDLVSVIRLALIGGGTAPEDAARLVRVYVENQPIESSYGLAVEILTALWFGRTPAPPAPSSTPPEAPDAAS